ncbi:hypothetical protein LguiB_028280 [Lonicera macranthoides]
MRMVNARFSEWLSILVCLLIGLKIEALKVNITKLTSAVAKGAVCLDGSAPAYFLDRGVGEGANSWLVHLQGGAWCNSKDSCVTRSKSHLGTSDKMTETSYFDGILMNKKEDNPNFYNWNRVFVRYCDGSSYTGDVEKVDEVKGIKLHYRGERVFDAIMEDLLSKGMKNASNVLLSGTSAGGLATILHCDKFRALLPTSTRVKCFSDGAFFLHTRDLYGQYKFHMLEQMINLHGSVKNLPPSCTSKMNPELCIYPQHVVPHMQTPLFILNSAYDPFQIQNILAPSDPIWSTCLFNITECAPREAKRWPEFRLKLINALKELPYSSTRGLFINSCHIHGQAERQVSWLGDPSSKLNNKAIGEAVGDWFYDRTAFQQIDNEHILPQTCAPNPHEPNKANHYNWE